MFENCYIYSLWSGVFRSYEGSVKKNARGEGHFVCSGNRTGFSCSIKPGIVYNAVVWLTEKDDSLARTILMEYEETQISTLQEKIDNHVNKIKILRGR